MFIAVIRFPEIPTDREAEFREWFDWSNQQLVDAHGLRSRRLLRSATGEYAALVEHDSSATFAAMHSQPIVAQIQARLHEVVPAGPQATQYDVVADSAGQEAGSAAGACCRDSDGQHPHPARPGADDETLAVGHTCCHAG